MTKRLLTSCVFFALCQLLGGSVSATCPSRLSEQAIFGTKGNGCVLRRAANSTGAYSVACPDTDLNIAYAALFDANHAWTAFSAIAAGSGLIGLEALDTVSLSATGAYKWATTWQAVNTFYYKVYTEFQLFSSALVQLMDPDFISDPAYQVHDTTRWGQAVAALSTGGRFVNVTSMNFLLGPNACHSTNKEEWRVVANIKNPDGTAYGNQNIFVSEVCTYNNLKPQYGQDMPAAAAFYYNGGKFVVTWYDRVRGKIFARIFTDAGSPVTGNIDVATVDSVPCDGDDDVSSPRVFAFNSGFVIVWTREDGYNQTWMRTFRPDGSALTSAAIAQTSTAAVTTGPDVHGISFQCPGSPYSTSLFAVSWWRVASQGNSINWFPEYKLFSGLSPVVALTSDLAISSTPIYGSYDVPGFVPPNMWERVSLNFFEGCTSYLILGMAWPVKDYVNGTYDELRDKFIKFIPDCMAISTMSGTEATGIDDSESCNDDTCLQLGAIPEDPAVWPYQTTVDDAM